MAAGGKSHLQVLKGVNKGNRRVGNCKMPKMHIWLNLNMAHKNRRMSKDRSALHFTHVASSQRVTEIRKMAWHVPYARQCTCRRGYGLYVRAATKTNDDLITKQHEV